MVGNYNDLTYQVKLGVSFPLFGYDDIRPNKYSLSYIKILWLTFFFLINEQNYDAVAGDVTIVGNRSQYVDFTLPFTESGIAMIAPVEDRRKNSWVFVKPLTWQLWTTIFCSFLFIGALVWVLEHQTNKDFRHSFWYQLGMILWFAFSTIVFAHSKTIIYLL